jgi:hypothetical protein
MLHLIRPLHRYSDPKLVAFKSSFLGIFIDHHDFSAIFRSLHTIHKLPIVRWAHLHRKNEYKAESAGMDFPYPFDHQAWNLNGHSLHYLRSYLPIDYRSIERDQNCYRYFDSDNRFHIDAGVLHIQNVLHVLRKMPKHRWKQTRFSFG